MMHRIFFAFIWIIGRVLLWIYRVDVKGLENLPKHSVLLCPNHSTDLDPVLIGLCLPLDYHLHFMAKAELFDNRALAWLIRTLGAFPVQRDGKDIQSIKTAMQVLHKGENLLIFPEGTTIRGGVGYHDGLPAHAHAGIAMIGVRTGATLVPVFCDGQKSPSIKRTSSSASRMCLRSRAAAARPKNCRPSPTKCCVRPTRSAASRWEARRCEGHLS